MKHIVITGGAGFIGSHLTDRLLERGDAVTVIDVFDDFYDPAIKRARAQRWEGHPRFTLVEGDIRDPATFASVPGTPDAIVHLAARAGVRPSIAAPLLYQEVNVGGTQVALEFARERGVSQFVFASSSSVYGVAPEVPWSEAEARLQPISPYASTKVSGELLGHVYAHLYGIRFLALRFFTVYGPRQRPDLAIHHFASRLLRGESITLFGDGTTRRDYTYISDIIAGIEGALGYEASDYEIVNLASGRPVQLSEMVTTIADVLGVEPRIEYAEEQPGDVPQTWGDIDKAQRLFGYAPEVSLADGIQAFDDWLRHQLSDSSI